MFRVILFLPKTGIIFITINVLHDKHKNEIVPHQRKRNNITRA